MPNQYGGDLTLEEYTAQQNTSDPYASDMTLDEWEAQQRQFTPPPAEAATEYLQSEFYGDIGASVAGGINSLVGMSGTLYGLSTGHVDNWLTKVSGKSREFIDDNWKSDNMIAAEKRRQYEVDQADDQLSKAGVAAWETVSDPILLSTFLAEQVPMYATVGLAGKGAGAIARVAGASRANVSRAALAGAAGIGGAMQGADSAQTALEQLDRVPDVMWLENSTVKAKIEDYTASGMLETEAQERAIAEEKLSLSRDTFAASALVSVATNLIPGALSIERALVGARVPAGSRLVNAGLPRNVKVELGMPGYGAGIAKAVLGEGFQEAIEEGSGKLAANIATQQVDPSQETYEGVGQAAGQGAVAGVFGLPAGVVNTASKRNAVRLRQLKQQVDEALATGEPLDVRLPEVTPPVAPEATGRVEPTVDAEAGDVLSLGDVGNILESGTVDEALAAAEKALADELAKGTAPAPVPAEQLIEPQPYVIAGAGEEQFSYGSSQVNLDEPTGIALQRAVTAVMDPADLNAEEGGIENTPHITISYGFDEAQADAVSEILAESGPVTATVTKAEVFKPEGKPYEVLVLAVESDELQALHSEVEERVELPGKSFPDYKPHITLAYVNKGAGDKYADIATGLEGRILTFDAGQVSGVDGGFTQVNFAKTQPSPQQWREFLDNSPNEFVFPQPQGIADTSLQDAWVRGQLESMAGVLGVAPTSLASGDPDPNADELLLAIAKLGGLNGDELMAQTGYGPRDFREESVLRRTMGKPIYRRQGQGRSLDEMREALVGHGYLEEAQTDKEATSDINQLLDQLDRSLRGERILVGGAGMSGLEGIFGGARPDYVSKALTKALAGERLGTSQAQMVQLALDAIAENADYSTGAPGFRDDLADTATAQALALESSAWERAQRNEGQADALLDELLSMSDDALEALATELYNAAELESAGEATDEVPLDGYPQTEAEDEGAAVPAGTDGRETGDTGPDTQASAATEAEPAPETATEPEPTEETDRAATEQTPQAEPVEAEAQPEPEPEPEPEPTPVPEQVEPVEPGNEWSPPQIANEAFMDILPGEYWQIPTVEAGQLALTYQEFADEYLGDTAPWLRPNDAELAGPSDVVVESLVEDELDALKNVFELTRETFEALDKASQSGSREDARDYYLKLQLQQQYVSAISDWAQNESFGGGRMSELAEWQQQVKVGDRVVMGGMLQTVNRVTRHQVEGDVLRMVNQRAWYNRGELRPDPAEGWGYTAEEDVQNESLEDALDPDLDALTALADEQAAQAQLDAQTDEQVQTQAETHTGLDAALMERWDEITDNRTLKRVIADFNGQKLLSEVTAAQHKEGQERYEALMTFKAREAIASSTGDREAFDALLALYSQQPLLNVRSSTSMENQAYSTPAPIAYLAARMAGISGDSTVYEPTAGNGMLLITANPSTAIVNELNDDRANALRRQGFTVTQNDASTWAPAGTVDSVIANPPFGKLRNDDNTIRTVDYQGYKLREIDHLISAKAMEAMRDDGRTVLIIGAEHRKPGKIAPNARTFFNWLYGHHNVVDHFEIDGNLYRRQGAGWTIAVIVVDGRAETGQFSPKNGDIERLADWEQIYERASGNLVTGTRAEPVTGADTGGDGATTATDGQVSAEPVPSEQVPRPSTPEPTDTVRPQPDIEPDAGGVGTTGSGGVDSAAGTDSVPAVGPELQPEAQADTVEPAGRTGQPEPGVTGTGRARPPVARPAESSSDFQSTYQTRSKGFNEKVLTPNNMAGPMEAALADIEDAVGGDLDAYLMEKLGYPSTEALHSAFMGLQVDAVAAAIYNFETKNKGIIIADQTGVGKGRQAAAILRYAMRNGKMPIFVTEKPNLFTDMYDDLSDIGTTDAAPFLLNVKEVIKGKSGERLFKNQGPGLHNATLEEIIASGRLPDDRNMLFLTYSQLNQENIQRRVLSALADDAVFVLDESHNAAGERETVGKQGGKSVKKKSTAGFVFDLIQGKDVVYLSATYAKRPDNMPIYYRTDLMDAVDSPDALTEAVNAGGIPLQQVVSSQLAEAGQLFRRERSFEGISIPTVIDYEHGAAHRQIADQVTEGLRAVVAADQTFESVVEQVKEAEQGRGGGARGAGNAARTTINHLGFTSIVHNYVRQLLLALKAQGVVDQAIALHQQGVKPVVALENTMGTFLEEWVDDNGLAPGDAINADYREVLLRALERTRRISIKDSRGVSAVRQYDLDELPGFARQAYLDAEAVIRAIDIADLPLSPIDFIRDGLAAAGITTSELTGRKLRIDYSGDEPVLSVRDPAEIKDRRATVDAYNDGSLDALILNAAGATGLSIHASERFTDQKPRHMIVAQTMLDVNVFMQALGRINRTGQVVTPQYTVMGLDLPAEKRPLAVGARKTKSLNANTSANSESDTSLDAPDMMNKYGDRIMAEYLMENPLLGRRLGVGVPRVSKDGNNVVGADGLMLKITGKMALLEVAEQEAIYAEVENSYAELIDFLNKTGQNDLEAATIDMDAKILDSKIAYEGKAPDTIFGQHTTLHKVDAKYQGKPPQPQEVIDAVARRLGDGDTQEAIAQGVSDAKAANDEFGPKLQERLASAQAELAELKAKQSANPDSVSDKRIGTASGRVESTEDAITAYERSKVAVRDLVTRFHVGNRFFLDLGEEHAAGVVVDIRDTSKPGVGNPYAPSKLRVKFLVASGVREIEVNMTQLVGETSIVLGGPHSHSADAITDAFSAAAQERRETRFIATGNLIAGSEKLGGRIINFTDNNGDVHQGILMPKLFKAKDFSALEANTKIPMRQVPVIAEFLREHRPKLTSSGRAVTVERASTGDAWSFEVLRANKNPIAKSVKFDDELRTAMGGDFYGSGKYMSALVPDGQLEAALARLIELTPMYAPSDMRPGWEASGGPAEAEAEQSFGPTSEPLPGSAPADSTSAPQVNQDAVQYGLAQSPIGFYSALARAAESIQAKGKPEQMLNQLKKKGGVRAEEIEWTGLAEYLDTLGEDATVERQQIVDYLAANGVEVVETALGQDVGGIDVVLAPDLSTVPDTPDNLPPGFAESLFNWYDDMGGMGATVEEFQDDVVAMTREGAIVQYPVRIDGGRIPSNELTVYSVIVDADTNEHVYVGHMDDGEGFVRQAVFGDLASMEHGIRRWLDRDYEETAVTDGPAEYEQYTLEGGENYRELLLRVPKIAADGEGYVGPHFTDRDLVAHVRVKDRVVEHDDGVDARVLFVEEIQSDLHQRARRDGYRTADINDQYLAALRESDELMEALRPLVRPAWDAMEAMGNFGFDDASRAMRAVLTHSDWRERWDVQPNERELADRVDAWVEVRKRWNASRRKIAALDRPVADAPFKGKGWVELAVKRLIRLAAEGGYDQIAWTTGAQQAERYGRGEERSGMHVEYDEVLPQVFKKLGRKLDKEFARVGQAEVSDVPDPVWSFEITPAMRRIAVEEGQALFATSTPQRAKIRGERAIKPQGPLPGMTRAAVMDAVRDQHGAVHEASGLQVEVVHTNQLPENIKERMRDDGTEDNTQGLILGRTVYLLADRINSAAEAQRIFMHEVVGHWGLNRLLGDDWAAVEEIYRQIKRTGGKSFDAAYQELQSRYGAHLDGDAALEVKEFIAVLAEKRVTEGRLGRFLRQVREFLKKALFNLGFKRPYSMTDLNLLLSTSQRFVRTGRASATGIAKPNLPPIPLAEERADQVEGYRRINAQGEVYQTELFDSAGRPAIPPGMTGDEKAAATKAVYEQEVENTVVSTVDVPTGTIAQARDAAAVAANWATKASENMLAIVTDAEGRILEVQRHSIGRPSQADVSAAHLVGGVLNVPGAAEVWFAHNHPGLNPEQSQADIYVTKSLGSLLLGTGVESRGMLTVALDNKHGGVQAHHFPNDGLELSDFPIGITDGETQAQVPVTEREVVRVTTAKAANSTRDMLDMAESAMGGKSGLMLFDSRLNPLGTVGMLPAEFAKLRPGADTSAARRILSAVAKTNATRAVVVNRAEGNVSGTILNLLRMMKAMDVAPVDVLTRPTRQSHESLESWAAGKKTFHVTGETYYALGDGFNPRDKQLVKKVFHDPDARAKNFRDRFDAARERAFARFRQYTIDGYDSLRTVLNDTESWMLAQLTRSTLGAVEMSIEHGHPVLHASGVLSMDTTKKGLEETLAPLGEDLNRFLYWIVANRSNRLLNEPDGPREFLMDQAEIDQMMQFNQDGVPGAEDYRLGRETLFDAVLADFQEFQDSWVQIGVDTGLINSEEADVWRDEGFYLPFYRAMQDEVHARGPRTLGGGNRLAKQEAYKRLRGSERQILDPLANAIQNWNHLASASLKNQAARRALDSAEAMGIATRLAPNERPGQDSIFIKEDGESVYYEIDTSNQDGMLVLNSLMALNWDGFNNPAMRAMRFAKRFLTFGVTASPEFKLANLFRDTIQALAVTQVSPNAARNLWEGWKATRPGTPLEIQMITAGALFGQSGYIHGADPEAVRYLVNKGVHRSTILTSPNMIKAAWDKYQDFGARLENVNRAADFVQSINRGTSLLEATFSARDHLDFARTGSGWAARALAQTVPFLNARLQGLDKMGRAGFDANQQKQFFAVISAYSLLSIINYLMMKGDDDYDEAEDWERDTYHLIKFSEDGPMFRLPRPFEVGAVANMAERAVEQFVDEDVHGKVFMERLLHTLLHTFSFSPVPQAFFPMGEVWANKNTFTDRPIDPVGYNLPSPHERKRAHTSPAAIGLSSLMNRTGETLARAFGGEDWDAMVLSPLQIEHLVQGYTGWLGATVAMGTLDFVVRKASGMPDIPEKKWTEYPIARRFFKTMPARNTKQGTMFYDQLAKIREAHTDVRNYVKLRQPELAQELAKNQRHHLLNKRWMEKQATIVSNINAKMTLITMDPDKSPEDKRAELDALQLRKNAIFEQSIQALNKARKKAAGGG